MTTLLPNLRTDDSIPVVERIATFYSGAIEDGSLRPGERLPTIRTVADFAGVTRATVQQAYRRLADAGLVVATVGRGTVVAPTESAPSAPPGPVGRYAQDVWRHVQAAGAAANSASPEGADSVELVADFAELRPDPSMFPVAEFRASIERQLRDHGAELLAYGDPSGSSALREYLASCPDTADPPASSDQILITSGAQQGIDLLVRTLTTPGAAVAAAVPTYHQLFGTLKSYGLRLAPVRSSEAGIDVADLERVLAMPDVQLLYVMPTFHNPTGRTLDLAQRREVIEVASAAGVPVLEDEFECELRFSGERLPTLRQLDPRGFTSTVRSFSKGLFPGVRVGWIHAGRAVLGPLSAMKRYADLGTSPLMQAALADFIATGGMARHLEAVAGVLRVRHAAAQQTLVACMPRGVRWTVPAGGFALWIELPRSLRPGAIARACAARGVRVTSGEVFDPFELAPAGLRLSLSRVDEQRVVRGIEVLAECIVTALGASDTASTTEHTTQPPLFF